MTLADLTGALARFDGVEVNMVAIPGEATSGSFSGLNSAIITYCEGRKDVVGLLEFPKGTSVANMVAQRKTAAFNSSFAALYGPWLNATHPVTGRAVVVPPAGYVAGVVARSHAEEGVGAAPAGPRRGILRGTTGPELALAPGDRDQLYQANINPLALVAGSFQVHGQKTLQLRSSATDRLNVRFLLQFIETSVTVAANDLVFEPNTKTTWERFKRKAGPFLRELQDEGWLQEFLIVCDETLNTPQRISQNQMLARVSVKPSRTAEFITIEFAIARPDANLSGN
jgi:phage tail sheath protein FI